MLLKRLRGRGYTLVEVILCIGLFMLLLLAVYRLFFSQVRSIRSSLEHITVNENVRMFLTRFGNDIRNASFLTEPTPSVREGVPLLLPSAEGVFCSVTQQVFDFSIKPPDPNFIREIKVDYRLQKAKNGTFEIIRDVQSNAGSLVGGPAKLSRKVCDGVKEIYVFSEIKRAARLNALALPGLKSFLSYEPYETDGTSPSLVHVRATFIRPERGRNPGAEEMAIELRTCFAMRGKPSYPNP